MVNVAVGDPMPPEEEAEHRRRHFTELADEADVAVKVIEEKLAGMKASLTAKRAEAKQFRASAREGEK